MSADSGMNPAIPSTLATEGERVNESERNVFTRRLEHAGIGMSLSQGSFCWFFVYGTCRGNCGRIHCSSIMELRVMTGNCAMKTRICRHLASTGKCINRGICVGYHFGDCRKFEGWTTADYLMNSQLEMAGKAGRRRAFVEPAVKQTATDYSERKEIDFLQQEVTRLSIDNEHLRSNLVFKGIPEGIPEGLEQPPLERQYGFQKRGTVELFPRHVSIDDLAESVMYVVSPTD
jgi:hypothetical protein